MRPASEAMADPERAGGVLLAGAAFFFLPGVDGFGEAAALRDADGLGDAFAFADGVESVCPASASPAAATVVLAAGVVSSLSPGSRAITRQATTLAATSDNVPHIILRLRLRSRATCLAVLMSVRSGEKSRWFTAQWPPRAK